MITAVIAEKPSVAKDIANVLNVRERHDGYLSGNGYLVTWAFGHLVQLAMPEAYGYAGFRRENLPILPQEFKYIPRQIREGKEYKPDPGVLKQLKVIREVFDRSDRIVVATDAGREGEAIHRYIYNYLGCRKPCLRLWISSLTDRAIREGLDNLRRTTPAMRTTSATTRSWSSASAPPSTTAAQRTSRASRMPFRPHTPTGLSAVPSPHRSSSTMCRPVTARRSTTWSRLWSALLPTA